MTTSTGNSHFSFFRLCPLFFPPPESSISRKTIPPDLILPAFHSLSIFTMTGIQHVNTTKYVFLPMKCKRLSCFYLGGCWELEELSHEEGEVVLKEICPKKKKKGFVGCWGNWHRNERKCGKEFSTNHRDVEGNDPTHYTVVLWPLLQTATTSLPKHLASWCEIDVMIAGLDLG